MSKCTLHLDGFNCLDCGINTDTIHEYYMVTNKIWKQVHPLDEGMLCIGCVELRLGRVLTRKDFSNAPLNNLGGWEQSERLLERLSDE